jgi:hypothetical protein
MASGREAIRRFVWSRIALSLSLLAMTIAIRLNIVIP